MAPPVLQTSRLVLRAHRVEDHKDCCRLWSDPEVTRFIGGRPSTAEEVWQRILRYAGLWQLLGYGYFAITDRQNGAFVGECGLADFHRDLVPPLAGPEVGWALLPQYQGRGLAQEALTAVLDWAACPTVCMIDPLNTPSLRLAQKCGFRETARTTYKDQPTVLLSRP